LTAFCLCSCHVNWGYVVSVFSIGGFDWICLRCCLQEMVLPLGRTQRVRALERMSRNVRQHDTRVDGEDTLEPQAAADDACEDSEDDEEEVPAPF
jgi:hypothetical protein